MEAKIEAPKPRTFGALHLCMGAELHRDSTFRPLMNIIKHESIIESVALTSDCGNYRFVLSRVWDKTKKIGAFLCANPSMADEIRNDTTVFKCGNLAADWGWGGFHILNLYPNYSTDPSGVIRNSQADDLNEQHARKIMADVDVVVIACGNGHEERLSELIRDIPRIKLHCLRRNTGGGYLHPSRIDPKDFPRTVKAFEE
jgi:hypothetical protein